MNWALQRSLGLLVVLVLLVAWCWSPPLFADELMPLIRPQQGMAISSSTPLENRIPNIWAQDLSAEMDMGRWRWSKTEQPWHYAAVVLAKGRTQGSGTCIASDDPSTKKVEASYVTTNRHVVGTGGTCEVTWLRPHSGAAVTKGTVVASGPGDQSLIRTNAPAWVRAIPVACPKCGDIAYRGTRLEVMSYGGIPRRGKDSLRHFESKVLGYPGGEIKYSSGLIGGDSGGSVISADKYWPRLHGINARSQGTYGIGPSDAMVNKMLENYFGVSRCTGKGECLPSSEQNMRKRLFGRLFGGRDNCGPDGCYPGDGDGDTHPDHPGDRDPPGWWGGGGEEDDPDEPIVPPVLNNDQLKRIDELDARLAQILIVIQSIQDSPSDNGNHREMILGIQRNKNAIESLVRVNEGILTSQEQMASSLREVELTGQRNSGSIEAVARSMELVASQMATISSQMDSFESSQTTIVNAINEGGLYKFRLWIDKSSNKVVGVGPRQ